MSPNYRLYPHYLHPQRVRKTKLSGELCNRNKLKPAYDVESGIESVEDACSHHHGNLAICHFFGRLEFSNSFWMCDCKCVLLSFSCFILIVICNNSECEWYVLSARDKPSNERAKYTRHARLGDARGALKIPRRGVIYGLNLLVLFSALRDFPPDTSVFPSPQKVTFG